VYVAAPSLEGDVHSIDLAGRGRHLSGSQTKSSDGLSFEGRWRRRWCCFRSDSWGVTARGDLLERKHHANKIGLADQKKGRTVSSTPEQEKMFYRMTKISLRIALFNRSFARIRTCKEGSKEHKLTVVRASQSEGRGK
jgi:hypothetical protein